MPNTSQKIDRFFLITVGILTIFGFVIFLSASLGLLAQNGTSFATVAEKQTISLSIGVILFFVFSKIQYSWPRKGALFILVGAVIINLLLFVPSLSLHFNGASRWLKLGSMSFQPSELLKIAQIIYLAAWAYLTKDRIVEMKHGLIPFVAIMSIVSLLLLAQRDTDTLVIIAGTGLIMFIVAGMPLRHVLIVGLLMGVLVGGVILVRPYALERVKTYFNRQSDLQGSGYQINQSLIAIGSGQFFGRGFGQSVQKFGYLPQPTDDSIFAVAAEEFGFVGSMGLLVLYVLLAASIFRIGNRSADVFGGLICIGIAILIIIESFMNMGAMLGLIPLSGIPLLFVSHGGTALIITLITMGIVANVSKYSRQA